MIPINIYALTRVRDNGLVGKLERQMSKRKAPLHVKGWEVEGIGKLAGHLVQELSGFSSMLFYYSFMIPRIGKEFDLLRIGEDTVINIELKSGNVSAETIKRQLQQNRYYLASLGKTVRSYTYISGEDKLYRLTGGNNLVESPWSRLCEDLEKQTSPFEGNIEELFLENNFLISPLTDVEKFLNREYFLTYQQRDIRSHILQCMEQGVKIQGFSGLPGTGKTLLLYDIAMQLSVRQRVCVLHFGFFPQELEALNARLKRIDFIACKDADTLPEMEGYACILVDEGHLMKPQIMDLLLQYAADHHTPILLTYDQEEVLAEEEHASAISRKLRETENYREYNLTNRIRMNKELSAFVQQLICPGRYAYKKEYPSVEVAYANDETELEQFLQVFQSKDYVYIPDKTSASGKEFDRIVMVIDETFYYDAGGYLRSRGTDGEHSGVRDLFHGLSRAQNKIAVLIKDNMDLMREVMNLLQ